jgi:ankyrin repeat protein
MLFDVNATAAVHSGRTALQAAAGGGHIDVVDRLLAAKAHVNAAAAKFSGRTALRATELYPDIVKLLGTHSVA